MDDKIYTLPENGLVIPVDKPYGWTSFQVVNFFKWRLKRICNQKKIKIGHAGTLDPLATGLLILCVGKQTKNIESYQSASKSYAGSLNLGYFSPSYDLEKRTVSHPFDLPETSVLEQAFKQLEGEYEQTAPMFSAKKFKGKRAFELAREGKEVVLKKNRITISKFDIEKQRGTAIDFSMDCSKGTYVRSAVRDVGQLLKTEAVMTALRRTKIGDYHVDTALKHGNWERGLMEYFTS